MKGVAVGRMRGVDPFVEEAVLGVLSGESLKPEVARRLCDVAPYSAESYCLQWGTHQLLHEASGGRGLVYAQIGLDAKPCAGNCLYCSFAACNSSWRDDEDVPLDLILDYSRILEENGVHLISLMTTMGFDFERYLEIVAAVRERISPDIAVMSNIGDFDDGQARRLKGVGVDMVYHAVRVGEGVITSLDPEVRWSTLRSAVRAGMRVSSGVEPLYQGVDKDAVVERMFQIRDFDPVCSGVGELVSVPGTKMASCVTVTKEQRRIFQSVWQLVAGRRKAPFGGENIKWVDAGTTPRRPTMFADREQLVRDIAAARAFLMRNEWDVPARPLPFWKIY